MKIQDIPAHMGVTRKALAEKICVTPQALNDYLSGRRGKPSEFVERLCQASGLFREEIIFPQNLPCSGKDDPAYWLNAALECLVEAQMRGADTGEATVLILKNNLKKSCGNT